MDARLTVELTIPKDAEPRELAAALDRIARAIRGMGTTLAQRETCAVKAGSVDGRWSLDVGQGSLFAAE